MTIKVNLDLEKEIQKESEKKIQNLINTLVEDLKKETPVKTGKARDGWKYNGKGIINDVPYIDDLNAGSSKQAPSHFIEKTLLSSAAVKPNGVIVSNK